MTFTVWNSADKAAGITLSAGDTIATGSGGNNSVRGTTSHASNTGKFYLEYHSITQPGGSGVIGFENGTVGLTTSSTNGEGVSPGGSFQGHTVGTPAGHVVCLAIDTAHLTAWIRIDGGNWNGSGTADPATNTGGVSYSGMSGGTTVFPFVWLQNGGTVTIVTDSSLFSFAAPSGFSPWDGVSGASGTITTALTKASISAAGYTSPVGTWASTEAADTAAFIGFPGVPGVTGQLVSTEITDTMAAAGYPAFLIAFAITETKDSFSAFVLQPKKGIMAVTEAQDIFAAVGVGYGENLAFALTEAQDVFAALGTALQPVRGPLTATEFPDSFRALGAGVTVSVNRPVFFVT